MRNPVLVVLLFTLIFTTTNCSKDRCKPASVSSEAPTLQQFATDNGITATPHSSGLFYEIMDPGTGVAPDINSKIVITFVGKMMNGSTFANMTVPNNDPPDNGPWALNALIDGWKQGIPLIKEGGRIRLLIPSAMAYGCTGYGDIPADSPLFFDITLIDVQ